MGLIMKSGKSYGGASVTASNIAYDTSISGLPTSTVQSALDYLTANSNAGGGEGIVINVEKGNWIEQANGLFTNTIAVNNISDTEMYDVNLYGNFTEEQAEAFDFLVSSISTANGYVILAATEKINVSFKIILRGKIDLENKNVYVSDLSATSIEYDNNTSQLNATDIQGAVDEIATKVNGLIVNITTDGWNLQSDGTYQKKVILEQITDDDIFDVCLYPGDDYTEEQLNAFGNLITSIETADGMLVLNASENITVSFRIFLYGKMNFSKSNLVALTDNVMEIIEIDKESYEKLSDIQKASGCYHVVDDERDLSAMNMSYDGSQTGLGNNVQSAIDTLYSKSDFSNYKLNEEVVIGEIDGRPIYRFVTVDSIPTTAKQWIMMSAYQIDMIVNLYGTARVGSSFWDLAVVPGVTFIVDTSGIGYVINTAPSDTIHYLLIVEYIKNV